MGGGAIDALAPLTGLFALLAAPRVPQTGPCRWLCDRSCSRLRCAVQKPADSRSDGQQRFKMFEQDAVCEQLMMEVELAAAGKPGQEKKPGKVSVAQP